MEAIKEMKPAQDVENAKAEAKRLLHLFMLQFGYGNSLVDQRSALYNTIKDSAKNCVKILLKEQQDTLQVLFDSKVITSHHFHELTNQQEFIKQELNKL